MQPGAAAAGGGSIDNPTGQMRLEVNFRYAPTHQEVAETQAALTRMSALLCDASEGRVRVREIRLTTSPADEDTADLWFHPLTAASGGAYHADGSALGRLGAHFDVFLESRRRPDHLVHALGHHAFGLGDQYDEQHRYGGVCGVGPGFEHGTLDERNHSVMQGAGGMACLGGPAAGEGCLSDDDCPEALCEAALMSEFSVPGNHDPVRAAGGACPRAQALSRIHLKGALSKLARPITVFDGSDYLSAQATSSFVVEIEVVDDSGEPTAAELLIYFTHRSFLTWQMTAAADSSMFGRPAGQLEVIEQWTLHFNEDASLRAANEVPPAFTLSGLAGGARDLHVAIDIGAPNPNADLEPGTGFDGLQMTRSGSVRIEHTYDGFGACTAPWCARAWNMQTSRWETTEQSLLHENESDWETIAHNYPFLSLPLGAPVAEPGEHCAEAPDFAHDEVGSDQMLLMLDVSRSMGWPEAGGLLETCGNYRDDDRDGAMDEDECADSKLAFAKAGIRAFVDLQDRRLVQLGALGFSSDVKELAPIDDLTRDHESKLLGALDGLTAAGETGIGNALDVAYEAFHRVEMQGRSRAAVLVTDGHNNTGIEPLQGSSSRSGGRVRWFTVPLGGSTDEELLSELAGASSGLTIPARSAADLPAVMAELAVRYRGEALVLPRTVITLAGEGGSDGGTDTAKLSSMVIPVEDNARALTVFLGARNPRVASWRVLYDLMGPAGERYDSTSPGTVIDAYYAILRVADPRPGNWTLRVIPDGPGVQESTALAWIANERADFFIDVLPKQVQAGGDVVVSASPSYVSAIDGGTVIDGQVLRPDGSTVDLALEQDAITRAWSGVLAGLTGKGIHEVRLGARVGDGARPSQGEIIFPGPRRAAVRVVPFERYTTTSFYLSGGEFPDCEGSDGDCDGDGIPDTTEDGCAMDADGDGLPNRLDDDSDNDEIPDRAEGSGDTDGDGLADFCDPEGAPASLVKIIDDDRRSIDLACAPPAAGSAEYLKESLRSLRWLTQTLRVWPGKEDSSPAEVVEVLDRALDLKRQALIIAKVLPEFCEKYQATMRRALELEKEVDAQVEELLSPRRR